MRFSTATATSTHLSSISALSRRWRTDNHCLLDRPRNVRAAADAFEGRAVPLAELGGGRIGGFEESEQSLVRSRGCAHRLIIEDELAEGGVEARLGELDRGLGEARRRGISVGIEKRFGLGTGAAGPEAGARNLVAVGLAGHRIGQMRDAAGMPWRRPARETGHREVEAAPEEMDRAHLADEARAEQAKDAVGREQAAEQPARAVGIIVARRDILLEADRRI